jgi:Kef-type K+ transport system membrane component KefB
MYSSPYFIPFLLGEVRCAMTFRNLQRVVNYCSLPACGMIICNHGMTICLPLKIRLYIIAIKTLYSIGRVGMIASADREDRGGHVLLALAVVDEVVAVVVPIVVVPIAVVGVVVAVPIVVDVVVAPIVVGVAAVSDKRWSPTIDSNSSFD